MKTQTSIFAFLLTASFFGNIQITSAQTRLGQTNVDFIFGIMKSMNLAESYSQSIVEERIESQMSETTLAPREERGYEIEKGTLKLEETQKYRTGMFDFVIVHTYTYKSVAKISGSRGEKKKGYVSKSSTYSKTWERSIKVEGEIALGDEELSGSLKTSIEEKSGYKELTGNKDLDRYFCSAIYAKKPYIVKEYSTVEYSGFHFNFYNLITVGWNILFGGNLGELHEFHFHERIYEGNHCEYE